MEANWASVRAPLSRILRTLGDALRDIGEGPRLRVWRIEALTLVWTLVNSFLRRPWTWR